jgi:PKD repeat protein
MKKILLFTLVFSIVSNVFAQQWVETWLDENIDFKTKQTTFENYYAGKDWSQQKGWKPFRRWEYNYQRRAQLGESEKQLNERYLNYFINQQPNSSNITANTGSIGGNWQFIGPNTTPTGGGAGRVNAMIKKADGQILVGAPEGGIWTRNGTTWTTNTDFQLNYLGISDILIDPSNTNLMYAATGDADAGDAPCIGVIKSTNGGATWVTAGLTNVSRIYKIVTIGTDYQQLIAATNNGLYKTTNGGTTWTTVVSGVTFHDLEAKPGTNNVFFAVSALGFYVSNDGGSSFSNTNSSVGLPTTGVNRKAIAVTPANAEYIYVLCSNSSNSGFHSFWRSTDGGNSFTLMQNGATGGVPNLLGWAASGNDASSGGQGWYDLAIAAHPTNANIVYTGGVNIWRTLDGGATFTLNGHWTGSGGAPYVHADIHNLDFDATGTLYASCDGGIFENSNASGAPVWNDISNGLQIAQMYKIGISQLTDGKVITGWQDNGTNFRDGSNTNWRRVLGGDGMESAIDPTNDNIMFGEIYYGSISRTSNGGTSWSNIVASNGAAGTVNEQGPWVTIYEVAKSNPSIMYVGKRNVYRNTAGGVGGVSTWTAGSGIPTSGNIAALAVAPTNPDVVYTSKGGSLYVTTDGTNFNLRNTGLPGSSITYIAISNDPNTAYITVNGGAGNLVFKTTNAGNNWTNISLALPSLTPTCIALDVNSPINQLYIGHLNGVYTKNDNMTNWVVYDNGLPNTEVAELEIMAAAQKLKAATYGRGAWESDLYSNVVAPCTTAPTANFSASATSICPNNNVTFTNLTTSCTATTTYQWTFAGGNPATSTSVTPTVMYANPGTYTVTLIATNSNGNNTKTTTNMIVVNNTVTPTINITADKTNICSYETVTLNYTGTNTGSNPTINWFVNNASQGNNSSLSIGNLTNGAVIRAELTPGTGAGCVTTNLAVSNSITINVTPQPARPTITRNGIQLVSSATNGNQWYLNGTVISGATANTLTPTQNGSYTVQVTTNGCVSESSLPYILDVKADGNLFPVPSVGNMTYDFIVPSNVTSYAASVYDGAGKLVWQEAKSTTPGFNRINFDLTKLAAGAYTFKFEIGTKTYTKRLILN